MSNVVKDIKYQYQLRAEEIAQEKYNLEFYDLSGQVQSEVYSMAMCDVQERLMPQAEAMYDYLKEM